MSRHRLHTSKLEEFAAYCERIGWKRELPKGDYEVLRMTRSGSNPLIVHTRKARMLLGNVHAQASHDGTITSALWDAIDSHLTNEPRKSCARCADGRLLGKCPECWCEHRDIEAFDAACAKEPRK